MINSLRCKTTLLLTGLVLLSACVMFNRFYDLVALVDGNDVAFTLPKSDFADKDVKFMLNDIGVSAKDACTETCVVWDMVRPVGSNVDLVDENFVQFPIKYGVTLPNMETRRLKPLRPGKYSAVAGFAMVKDGKIIGSKQVITGFTID